MNLNLINKLIKKSWRLQRNTGFVFFQRTAIYFEQSKKKIIFSVIDKLKVEPNLIHVKYQPTGPNTIWICWFQGLGNAPDLVRRCIESVQKNNQECSVIIITEDNFSDYISIPPNILKKYKAGLIGRAHFSDILRCCLLYYHGGIWLDSTIFLSRKLPAELSKKSFCSLRFCYSGNYESISKGFWTTYLLASPKNGYLIGCVMSSLLKYWDEHDAAIDYFLMDYVFCYYFEKDILAKEIILSQPIFGNKRFLIKENMNNVFSDELKENFSQDEIGIYKLSYKTKYNISVKGQPTVYSKILDGSLHF
ncbi:capsular polysaccharide synthesis protein [Leclercia sp.]|uniref:capsular polysaccharide synthesis protein n=1 Tax=Leclercia sp. TaxID=1898428 RepID=UPI0028A68FE0|nr:capsular polysaccharide synthesis protein [Leclercia sp.]